MKVEKEFFCFENVKGMLNYKDIIVVILAITGIVVANVQLLGIMEMFDDVNAKIIICDIIICAVIISMLIYCVIKKIKSIEDIINIKSLEMKNKNLLEVSDSMRSFKHDFNNIIQAIDGYIYLDDMKSLQRYFESLIAECNHVKLIDILNNQGIENPAIYGVLVDKCKIAEEKHIEMNIEILVNLKCFNGKSYLISRMLGILLDNALEAASECDKNVVNVQFMREDKANRCVIVVENTYNNKDVDTTMIFEKNYTTKKEKGNSGLGLWKIQDILKKNKSFELYTTKDDEMFKQKLEIYN